MADFDAVVVICRCWPNGVVDVEARAIGGPLDGNERTVRLDGGAQTPLLDELTRIMESATT